MFHLKDVRFGYATAAILEIEHWHGAQGEHWLVHGSSGSGKSTLLNIMAGLLRPSRGEVEIAGSPFHSLSFSRLDSLRGSLIGIIHQRLHFIQSLTIAENLSLAQKLATQPRDIAKIMRVLESLSLAHCFDKLPREMSQGELQRAAIARAVMKTPRLILADEPTSSLDDAAAMKVADLLEEQASYLNATLVIATHDARLKGRISKRLLLEKSP